MERGGGEFFKDSDFIRPLWSREIFKDNNVWSNRFGSWLFNDSGWFEHGSLEDDKGAFGNKYVVGDSLFYSFDKGGHLSRKYKVRDDAKSL